MVTMTVIEMLKELKKEIMDFEDTPDSRLSEAYNKGISDADDVVRSYIRKIEDKEIGVIPV